MNKPLSSLLRWGARLRSKACLAGLALVCLLPLPPLLAVTLADFGYTNANLIVNGKQTLGTRPLLIICANFSGQTPLPQPISYYSNLVFNAGQMPSVNGFFQACSDGAFSIAPSGAIMLNLPESQNFMYWSNLYPSHVRDGVYGSNIIAQAILSGQLNLAQYDGRHDGNVTPDELSIMVLVSDVGWQSGGARVSPTVSVPGINYTWGSGASDPNANFALLGAAASSFIVICEEIEETWGATDIYGPFAGGSPTQQCLSLSLSPQSCTYDSANLYTPNPVWNYYYLDPWNRMELGWCQPRINSLTAGGIATISAAQAGDPTAPIILYDPARGVGEFFILEYRTSTNSIYGSGYDQDVGNDHLGDPISSGLVIWHVQQDANHFYTSVTSPSGVTNTSAVWAENSPDLIPSDIPKLWGSNSTTPALKWIDGTQTLTTIHVRPFNPGDNTITVEWVSAEDTWVDFNYTGSPQSGTFSNPYKTMAAGLNAVSYGGTLHLKTGTNAETPTISKPMKIVGYNGPAKVGS